MNWAKKRLEENRMKVLLVNPTKERLFEQPSLGLLYIAAALRKTGYRVKYIEGTGEALWSQIHEQLYSDLPEVIGFNVMSPMFNEVKTLIEEIKHECWKGSGIPEPMLIAGGAHATIMPETLLEIGFDYVIQGEGEKAIVELLAGNIIKGIRTLHFNPIDDLDSLEFPARDLLPKKYLKRHAASIMASRGCPFNCSFCQPTLRTMFGSNVRKRSVWNVLEEINQCYIELGINYFEFFDDTFTADKNWVYAFCNNFPNHTPKGSEPIHWECLSRVNTIDESLLIAMKKAGCYRITFGVESGSQEILNFYRKGITVEQTKEAFKLSKKVGIHRHALFMLGAPIETQETIKETEQLIEEIKPDSIFISITTPLPFTDLWNDCQNAHIIQHDWSEINYYHKPMIKLQFLNAEEIVKARKRILKNFYLHHPGFVLKLLKARGWSYTKTAVRNLF